MQLTVLVRVWYLHEGGQVLPDCHDVNYDSVLDTNSIYSVYIFGLLVVLSVLMVVKDIPTIKIKFLCEVLKGHIVTNITSH